MFAINEEVAKNIWGSMRQISKVYETAHYSAFKLIDENRAINQSHVNKIVKSMQEQALFTPIIVNENMEIIDGQHRFYARKELALPIPFIVCENYGLEEIQKLNESSKNWSSQDYLDSYAKLGYESYVMLKRLQYRYPDILFGSFLAIASNNQGKGSDLERFKQGRFQLRDYNTVEQVCREVSEIIAVNEVGKHNNFVRAYVSSRNVPGFDPKKFKSKLEKHPTMFQNAPTVKAFREEIHKLYNYHSSQKLELRPL